MDGSTVYHSDSDSGESWTVLDKSPSYGDEAPDVLTETFQNRNDRENIDTHSDKDEDTDGISIISDSEPESTPCDLNYVQISTEESPADQQEIPLLACPLDNSNHKVPVEEETDFLGDNVKFKTYVHKRNPKVGSILDIIMLGTFVITAGMALGHLWSCKNECTTQTSVNKILSNLYKLQEENAFLRGKLKEITDATSYQFAQQKQSTNNKSNKQLRCKKIFEEPVMKNYKGETAIKCVEDNKPDVINHNSFETPEFEKEFLNDIDKMKDIYVDNKDWIDKEVQRQYDELGTYQNNINQNTQALLAQQIIPTIVPLISNQPDTTKMNTEKAKTHKQINLEKQIDPTHLETPLETKPQIQQENSIGVSNNIDMKPTYAQPGSEKKITYADSLKTDQPLKRVKRSENIELSGRWNKEYVGKRKRKDDDTQLNLSSFSEDDIKKDDRYTGPKTKYDKKKHDRHKSHKKQKRNNKYEQWEMKGGYLKDYDEFSITSSQDNDISLNRPGRKYFSTDFENYVNMLIEADNNASKEMPKTTKDFGEGSNKSNKHISKNEKRKRAKDLEWYDQRATIRAEARRKLEHELFGENTSNNAAWYFRRMQKREQCREQKDNSTFKKLSKRKMNFKMKR